MVFERTVLVASGGVTVDVEVVITVVRTVEVRRVVVTHRTDTGLGFLYGFFGP